MPIKMRQNSKEDVLEETGQKVMSPSLSSDGSVGEESISEGSEVPPPEQGEPEHANQNLKTSSASKVIHYL